MKKNKLFALGMAVVFSIFCVSCSVGCASASSSSIVVAKELDIRHNMKNAFNSSVEIQDEKGRTIGSGTILENEIDAQMQVITAWHVVDALNAGIFVKVPGSSQVFRMTVVKYSKLKDLCLIKSVDPMKFDGASVRLSLFNPRIGQDIFVIGNPMGATNVVNKGNISDYIKQEDTGIYHFRVSAPIIYSNSGGGLFNKHGKLLGVVVSIGIVSSDLYVGVDPFVVPIPGFFTVYAEPGAGFVVALDEVKKFLKEKPKPSESFMPLPDAPSLK